MAENADEAHDIKADQAAEKPPTLYAWYVAVVLMLTYTLSLLDRKLPFILVESIKRDLNLSDTQIGLMTGVVFALVYSTVAIPIASLADRRSRKWIIAIAVIFWSNLTALGGFAQNFWQLATTRVGVAAGEAACSPAAHSIIAGYFSQRFRARAMGLYFVGAQLGMLLGLVLGGWINDLANWRVAMFMLGAPGIVLAIILLTTVKEPPRQAQKEAALASPGLLVVCRTLFSQATFNHMMLAALFFMFTGGATQAFTPAYIIRTYGLTAGQTGLVYGLTVGLAGIVGAALGGFMGDKLRAQAQWRALMFVSVAFFISVPCLFAAYAIQSLPICLAAIFVAQVASMTYAGPSFATIQSLAPPEMHAVASAIYLFALSGVGLSLGPLVVGALSDFFQDKQFENPLRWAIVIAAIPQGLAALHLLVAAGKLRTTQDRIPAVSA